MVVPGVRRTVAVVATAAALLTVTACAPRVIGEPWDGAGPGALATDPADTGPAVAWIDRGTRFSVTTYGSSSCPLAPTDLQADEGALRLTMTRTGGSACTADFGPTSWALDVPDDLRGRGSLAVTVRLPERQQALRLD